MFLSVSRSIGKFSIGRVFSPADTTVPPVRTMSRASSNGPVACGDVSSTTSNPRPPVVRCAASRRSSVSTSTTTSAPNSFARSSLCRSRDSPVARIVSAPAALAATTAAKPTLAAAEDRDARPIVVPGVVTAQSIAAANGFPQRGVQRVGALRERVQNRVRVDVDVRRIPAPQRRRVPGGDVPVRIRAERPTGAADDRALRQASHRPHPRNGLTAPGHRLVPRPSARRRRRPRRCRRSRDR